MQSNVDCIFFYSRSTRSTASARLCSVNALISTQAVDEDSHSSFITHAPQRKTPLTQTFIHSSIDCVEKSAHSKELLEKVINMPSLKMALEDSHKKNTKSGEEVAKCNH